MIHFEANLRAARRRPARRPLLDHRSRTRRGTFVAHDIDSTWVYMHAVGSRRASRPTDYAEARCAAHRAARASARDAYPFTIRTIRTWTMTAQVAERYRERPRLPGRRRRASLSADRRPRPQHRRAGRAQPRVEARRRRSRLGAPRAARHLRDRAPARRAAQRRREPAERDAPASRSIQALAAGDAATAAGVASAMRRTRDRQPGRALRHARAPARLRLRARRARRRRQRAAAPSRIRCASTCRAAAPARACRTPGSTRAGARVSTLDLLPPTTASRWSPGRRARRGSTAAAAIERRRSHCLAIGRDVADRRRRVDAPPRHRARRRAAGAPRSARRVARARGVADPAATRCARARPHPRHADARRSRRMDLGLAGRTRDRLRVEPRARQGLRAGARGGGRRGRRQRPRRRRGSRRPPPRSARETGAARHRRRRRPLHRGGPRSAARRVPRARHPRQQQRRPDARPLRGLGSRAPGSPRSRRTCSRPS